MTFELCNAAQTFQRYMHKAFRDLEFFFAYFDDIAVASANIQQHHIHLRQVFEKLHEYKPSTINPSKCSFGKESIEFLGHKINHQGIKPLQTKVKAITNFPLPTQ